MAEATWLDIFTRYVIPPLLGGAGGILTVYGQWGIEKRRQRLQARRDLVNAWRKDLIPLLTSYPATRGGGGENKYAFMDHESYSSLRPHLRPDLRTELENTVVHVNVGGPAFPRQAIMDEIARIERKWRLL
ncbi:hypothetical protein [Bradyrhizobium japonicum]|uniref:hypothetical protein n=1 Tax=Bradyrhizobium japonicum TaxID=375 RepID=UPI00041D7CF4|nr:hypothetical protein [Bradyrhizobium japonicum]